MCVAAHTNLQTIHRKRLLVARCLRNLSTPAGLTALQAQTLPPPRTSERWKPRGCFSFTLRTHAQGMAMRVPHGPGPVDWGDPHFERLL